MLLYRFSILTHSHGLLDPKECACRVAWGDIAYLGRIIKCPSEVRIIGERSLHALYGIWNICPGQWDDLDRHGSCNATTVSITGLNGQV